MQAYSFVLKKSSCARKINISHIRSSICISFFHRSIISKPALYSITKITNIRYPFTYNIMDSLLFLDVLEFQCAIVAIITNQRFDQ